MAKPIKFPKFADRFNEALNGYFKGEKVTQKKMEKFFGVSEITARQWQKGQNLPNIDNGVMIAEKLGVCVEWLLTGRGAKYPQNVKESLSEGQIRLLQYWGWMDQENRENWLYMGSRFVSKKFRGKIIPLDEETDESLVDLIKK